MSVLVKDMSMPKNCMWMDDNHEVHSCPLLDGEDNCKLQDCKEEWNWADQYAGCPLVEVKTPHGRLIDADALIKALIRKEPFSDCARVVIAECMEEVRHAPTVKEIEAEGET